MIASAGESIIDFTPITQNGKLKGFLVHPGGSPYNVAVGVARLGAKVAFVGKLSNDMFGNLLINHLLENNVETYFVARSNLPSALAFVTYEHGDALYTFRVSDSADVTLSTQDLKIEQIHRQVGIFHFGSLILGFSPAGNTILELARGLQQKAIITYDPNVRKDLIPSWHDYMENVMLAIQIADILKISSNDIMHLGLELNDIIRLENRPPIIILTKGKDGCTFYSKDFQFDLPAVPVTIEDTIGAGDAFMAAILYKLSAMAITKDKLITYVKPKIWEEILTFALKAAAVTCSKKGADPPTLSEINKIYP
jgi:fructokinase